MNNKILISIIIPVYNSEEYIRECLDSIINQSIRDIEIIIIDDGSTDNTRHIITEYMKFDERIKYIYQTNKGVSEARNRGIKEANGLYITFVDADDWLELDMYESLYNRIKNEDAQIIMCSFIREYENKVTNYTEKFPFNGKTVFCGKQEINSIIREMMGTKSLSNMSIMGCVWRILFDRDVIIENKMYFNKDIIVGEDLIFCINILKKCKKVLIEEKAFYHYRFTKSSAMIKYRENQWDISCRFNKEFRGVIEDIDIEDKNELANFDLVRGAISSISSICKKDNTNSLMQKLLNINEICNNKDLVYAIKNINISNLKIKDKIRIILIKYKFSALILMFYINKHKCTWKYNID